MKDNIINIFGDSNPHTYNPSMGSLILLCLHGVPFELHDDLDKKKRSGLCTDHQTRTEIVDYKFSIQDL